MKQKDGKSFELNKYWLYLIVICIGVTGFGIYRLMNSNTELNSDASLTTATVRSGDIRLTAIGSGTLIPAVEVEIGFEYGGVVEEILVETGDEVGESQLLARLDGEDLQTALVDAEQNLRELTSDAAIAASALEIAEAQKAVLSAESQLSFFISPYVLKAEIRLREVEQEFQDALQAATLNPSDEADIRVAEAQEAVDQAILNLSLNCETYYEEYVPDFFNFPWLDEYGYWHDYFDPPSETEVAVVWAELAVAEARVEEAQSYLAVLPEDVIPENASGTQLTALEKAGEAVVDAQEALEAAQLLAPIDGVIVELDIQVLDRVNTESILTIAQLDPPTLEVSFDESDWGMAEEGYPVEVIFDSLPEKTYQGQIVHVDPSLQSISNTTTVSALVELDISSTGWANPPLGSAASVEVIAGEVNNVVLLPLEALQEQEGNRGTVLVLENGQISQQEVELGLRDVIYIEVAAGLSAGDVVVIGNLEY